MVRSDAKVNMMEDKWTCLMECVAICCTYSEGNDCLHTFKSIDGDGGLIQMIEGDDFCKVGDKIRITLTKVRS